MQIKRLPSRIFTKKRGIFLGKILGFTLLYFAVLVLSVYFTMNNLIKGKEITAPDLLGKKLNEVKRIAKIEGFKVKEKVGYFQRDIEPLTIIDQHPDAGTMIKEDSFITVYISSKLVQVTVPDLTGFNLKECERLLEKNNLKRRFISYMETRDFPADLVIGQSYPGDTKVPIRTEVDILVSKGHKSISYIMPNLIGMNREEVTAQLEKVGLKIHESRIQQIEYPGLRPDIIVKQRPLPGFQINAKYLIDIKVSK